MLCDNPSEPSYTVTAQEFTRKPRILAVDDSPDNLYLLEAILAEEGYEICFAEDGESALAQVQYQPPDLVLLDVMMPGIDGYEVARRIRQNPVTYIPILLITAHDQPCVVEGLDAGADDFIRKPIIEVDELLARVRSLLRLKHAIDDRDHMLRQREDFVSRLTHDLRTPLVAVDRMYGLMLQGAFGELPTGMDEVINTMIRNNENLLHMVNTLLEVYRYEADAKSLTLAPFEISQLVQEVVKELAPLAEQKGLAITTQLDPLTKRVDQMVGDRIELRRVLVNLIGNAIKFTDSGGVDIRVYPLVESGQEKSGTGKSTQIKIEVQDTGSGIPSAEQATLFERFRQGKNRRAGSGLGLYLSRRIVEAHGGSIAVQSEPQQGSLFTVILPATQDSNS